jgi:hypothetical protein
MLKVPALTALCLIATQGHADNNAIKPLTAEYQQRLIKEKLYTPDCPIPLSRLRKVTVSYVDFEGKEHDDGKLIVQDIVAENTLMIFNELKQQKFPIRKIKLTSDYHGDDEASMEDDNTSAFNCRKNTTHPNEYSLHAYGLAIDINPLENPYVGFSKTYPGQAIVLPKNATEYVNRIYHTPGSTESIVSIFAKYGFTEWGGYWRDRIDYQHFQAHRSRPD